MCRSIKPLRTMDHPVSEQEIQEAALQYVRKVSGYRKPSKANEGTFQRAVDEIAEATRQMLADLNAKESKDSTAKTFLTTLFTNTARYIVPMLFWECGQEYNPLGIYR